MNKNMLMNHEDETPPDKNISWPDEIYLFSRRIYKN